MTPFRPRRHLFPALLIAGTVLAAGQEAPPYREPPASDLVRVFPDLRGDRARLVREAAEAFRRLETDARRDGVRIAILSAFRGSAEQDLLFRRATRKYGSPGRASMVVKPGGFSEHQTGRAVDLGDKDRPDKNFKQSFERTAAFLWLRRNAARYGFTLSYPVHDPPRTTYEPWHWFHGRTEAGPASGADKKDGSST
jgi:D-alanyl-D-alanine carboxypeptidase